MIKFKAYQIVVSFILLVIAVSCDHDNQMVSLSEEEFKEQLDKYIPGWMDKYDVPGVSIALIKNGEMSWSNAYGFADLEKQTRMTPETVCRVESISKSVTAHGVMRLVEMEKIRLDDPVIRYLTSWEFPDSDFEVENITIRNLLSNTSGIPLGTIGLEYAPEDEKPSVRETLDRDVHLVQEPGKSFLYSNPGFNILEVLIEDVTGRNFTEFMEDEILAPSGMANASFEWSEDFHTPVPNGYNLRGEPISVYVYSDKAAGGLFASAEDIASFISSGMLNEFYSSENALSQNSIRELYSPVVKVADIYALISEHYGLGHFLETLPNGQRAVFSGGQGNGWMNYFHLVPETGNGIVILTNSSRSLPLISHTLSDWAEWNGFGSVGMGLITKAITGLWILIGLMFAVCFWKLVHIILDIRIGKRQLSVTFREYTQSQYVYVGLFMILIFGLLWSLTREYLIITSIFPGVSKWLIFAIGLVAFVLLILVLFPKTLFEEKSAYLK